MAKIIHQPGKNCFTIDIDHQQAVLEYQLLANKGIDFSRTYVPDAFRGMGLAEKLVREGLQWANEQGYTISASCWYVDKFLR